MLRTFFVMQFKNFNCTSGCLRQFPSSPTIHYFQITRLIVEYLNVHIYDMYRLPLATALNAQP